MGLAKALFQVSFNNGSHLPHDGRIIAKLIKIWVYKRDVWIYY